MRQTCEQKAEELQMPDYHQWSSGEERFFLPFNKRSPKNLQEGYSCLGFYEAHYFVSVNLIWDSLKPFAASCRAFLLMPPVISRLEIMERKLFPLTRLFKLKPTLMWPCIYQFWIIWAATVHGPKTRSDRTNATALVDLFMPTGSNSLDAFKKMFWPWWWLNQKPISTKVDKFILAPVVWNCSQSDT